MKYTCDIPGLEHNFIELSDRWSLDRIIEILAWSTLDNFLDILRPKVVSMSLDCDEGKPLTDPEQLTNDGLKYIDFQVFHWFKFVIRSHVDNLRHLGEASGRRLSVTVGETAAQTKPSPTAS